VRWLTRLTNTGLPASPVLATEIAEKIRGGRLQLSKTYSYRISRNAAHS
jgi:hypothetical protein